MNGYNPDEHFLDGKIKQPVDMSHLQLKMAEMTIEPEIKKIDENNKECRYLSMCWKATNNFISSKIKIEN